MARKKATLKTRLQGFAQLIEDICRIHGFNKPYDATKTLISWERAAAECGYMKFAKYKTAAFYSFYKKQEQPTKPFTQEDHANILMGGAIRNFVRDLMYESKDESEDHRERRESFLHTILYAKKGAPRPGPEAVKIAIDETILKLTTAEVELEEQDKNLFSRNWGDIEEMDDRIMTELDIYQFQQQLDRTVDELFTNKSYDFFDRTRLFFPSTNANYIRGRNEAGAIGAILDHPTLLEGLQTQTDIIRTTLLTKEQISTEYGDEDYSNTESLINMEGIGDIILDYLQPEDQDTIIQKVEINTQYLERRFRKFWSRLLDVAMDEEPIVEPVGLEEPLKVRVITKGPAFTYTVLKTLQKKLHHILKSHPFFSLIGEEVTEAYVTSRMGNKLKENEGYASIDYRDATNEMKRWASNRVANRISDRLKLDERERALFIRALTEHIIFNPDTGEFQIQMTGQLMGSIISFPILCIVCATVLRITHEVNTKRIWTLRDLPGCDNGDDGLLKTDKQGFKLWERIGKFVGLNKSLGKTYFSREFLNINSTTFKKHEFVSLEEHEATGKGRYLLNHENKKQQITFEHVKYVNMGLVYGMTRSGVSNKTDMGDKIQTAGERLKEIVVTCPKWAWKQVFKIFIKRNGLDTLTLPYFIPQWLGGLGLPKEFGEPSDLDLRIAQDILYNWKKRRPKPFNLGRDWNVRQLASKISFKPKQIKLEEIGEKEYNSRKENYERYLGLRGIELLFRKEITLQDLHSNTASNLRKSLNHNTKLWNYYLHKKGKPNPLPLSKLASMEWGEGIEATFVSEEDIAQIKRSNRKIKDFLNPNLPTEDELWDQE